MIAWKYPSSIPCAGLNFPNTFRPDGEIPDDAFDTSDLPCKGNLATIDEGEFISIKGQVLKCFRKVYLKVPPPNSNRLSLMNIFLIRPKELPLWSFLFLLCHLGFPLLLPRWQAWNIQVLLPLSLCHPGFRILRPCWQARLIQVSTLSYYHGHHHHLGFLFFYLAGKLSTFRCPHCPDPDPDHLGFHTSISGPLVPPLFLLRQ